MEQLKLLTHRHPDKGAKKRYDALVGIDDQKEHLIYTLQSILDNAGLEKWLAKNHQKGLPYLSKSLAADPLVILSGDVGCGKTELALSVATALSELMKGETINVFETPSDIRGQGHVGELSFKITEAFKLAKQNLRKGEYAILVIDEGDDLATSRDQMQAHHEDRAGVNALIKELDRLQREGTNMAVILITNRASALDPAVVRRASIHLKFERPTEAILTTLIKRVFEGVTLNDHDVEFLVKLCSSKGKYTYSDVVKRIAKQSLISAWRQGKPLTKEIIVETIGRTEPSPGIETVNSRAK